MKQNNNFGITKLDFYTPYRQFYIIDRNPSGSTDSENFWTDAASNRRLAVEDGVLGVGTECYGPVEGEIEFLNISPNVNDFAKYDHVVEGDLEVRSGVLQIIDCPTGAVKFEKIVKPGNYRVRVYSINLDSVDSEDEGDDYYRIEVWQGKPEGVKLYKEYNDQMP
ncbi:hypothetical protein [Pontibacter mangrovi]|uniref:Uncharacterized protein n=1 Tax=Pontibacter mangrovi TaxID=2589816 RepID=A0A501W973_9BACT|nr:hypothetical protein [Pontibacter mangrovi]TPE42116.1 hypothetical protein FJM65_18700 [Pontibacter mangrovi]